MKTIKLLLAVVLSATLGSCIGDFGFGQIQGNGNVQKQLRPVGEFNQVSGASGLDVYLTKGAENRVEVEADQNLMDIIETEVVNGKLRIRANKNIGRAMAKKIHVTFVDLNAIDASSGADVIGNSLIRSKTLKLNASSGADLELEIFAKEVFAETSSGSDMKLSGKAESLSAKASSGSDLDAKDLLVVQCNANASSGADITVRVKDRIEAEASSGGDIHYYGDPAAVSNRGSSTGGIHKM